MKAILTAVLLTCTLAAQQISVNRTWRGTLEVGAQKLRLVLHMNEGEDGALKATLDSTDQGAIGIPVDSITVNGNKLRFSMNAIGGSYEGTVVNGRIEGTWTQGANSLPLVFETSVDVPPARPQEPKPPFPYKSEEVTVLNGEIKLAGTFTYPASGGPFVAELLVTGSGPQDRDESLFGHKPFLVLSDYLTRAGLAVLRLDDRGTGKSTGIFKQAGLKEFTSDALAAVRWIKGRKEVDGSKIGIIGHSEGGSVGPLAAAESKDVAFVVMMAGPGVPFESLLAEQSAGLMRAAGASDMAIAASQKIQQRIFAMLREEPDDAKARERLRSIAAELKTQSPQEAAALESQATRLLTPEIRSLLAYDAAGTLRKVVCPVLAIDGEKDLQVSADQNLPGIAAALAAGHNRDFTVEKLPGLNHLFQTAKTGSVAEYGQIAETISPRALQTIGQWIALVTW